MTELDAVNNELHDRLGNDKMNLMVDEICHKLSLCEAKKSYIALYTDGNAFISWQRDKQYDNHQLKMRGITWSKMNDRLRQIVKDNIRQYLLSSENNVVFYQSIYDKLRQMI